MYSFVDVCPRKYRSGRCFVWDTRWTIDLYFGAELLKKKINSIICELLNLFIITWLFLNNVMALLGGTSILGDRGGGGGGLSPTFASEILVGAPNFASKNIGDKYSKFCPLKFRYDPKIGIFFPNFCVLW